MSRRIGEMANDIKSQVTERMKKSGSFSLQMDESTDVANCANLLVFARQCLLVNLNVNIKPHCSV